MLKLLLLGDTGVGKTSLLNQYVNQEFSAQYKATIGSDFSSKQVEIDSRMVTLQIWDTAGQERFQSLGPTFYRGTDCCILVYDVTQAGTYENIKKWRNEFSMQLGLSNTDDFAFLLLGNKCDLQGKAVQSSAAREFAQMNGDMLFYEVSAKSGENVNAAFDAIVRAALQKAVKEEFHIPPAVVNLTKKEKETKSGCC
jgi:Ras-related protein Rab-7A